MDYPCYLVSVPSFSCSSSLIRLPFSSSPKLIVKVPDVKPEQVPGPYSVLLPVLVIVLPVPVLEMLTPDVVDGLIVLAAGVGQEVSYKILAEFCRSFAPIPVISIGEKLEGIPSLLVENQAGLRALLLHLIDDHGYRRLAFVQGPENNPDAQERFTDGRPPWQSGP